MAKELSPADRSLAVVMPSFNTPPDLFRVATQSVERERINLETIGLSVELIVVDDDSTNRDTVAYLEELERHGEWVRIIRLAENKGPGQARNIGVAASQANLIAFLDSDDYWLRGGITALCRELLRHDDIDWIAGDMFLQMDHDAHESRSFLLQYPNRYRYVRTAFESDVPVRLKQPVEAFLEGSLCGMGTCVLKRSIFHAVGGFDPSLRKGDDTELYWRLSRVTDFAFLAQPTLVYRRYGGTTSSDGAPLSEWEPAVLTRMLSSELWRPYRPALRRRLLRTLMNLSGIWSVRGFRKAAAEYALRAIGVKPLSPRAWMALAKCMK